MASIPNASSRSPRAEGRSWRGGRRGLVLICGLVIFAAGIAAAGPAHADEYDPKRSGHPLRVVAYFFHPIGVLLDYAIFRPAHWVGEHEPLRTIFGHTD